MLAGEYCNREVVVTGPATSIREAARLMREFHVGTLVVTEPAGDGQRPLGIVTDRDLVIEVLAEDVDLDAVALKDIMSDQLVTVEETVSLLDALERMREKGVRRLPVVNSCGQLAGLLAADDLLEVVAEQMNDLAGLIGREIRREQHLRP